MRLLQRTLRAVTVYAPAGYAQDCFRWGAGTAIRAAVYPGEAAGEARISGERVEETRVLLCEDADALSVGMGVCVDAADGKPDFRVVSLEKWDHARAILRRIPEGKRG